MDEADSEAAVHEALSRRDWKQALTLLRGLYGKAIYSYCRHMLGDAAVAEDVQQTTFVQAYTDLGRYGGRSSLWSWLLGIARHRCLDMLKMRRREEKHVERPEAPPEVPSSEQSADEQLQVVFLRKHFAHCLGELPVEVRDAVVLRYIEQLSYQEMAKLTGTRAATLQMRVARAMKGLRRCLEASGVTP